MKEFCWKGLILNGGRIARCVKTGQHKWHKSTVAHCPTEDCEISPTTVKWRVHE